MLPLSSCGSACAAAAAASSPSSPCGRVLLRARTSASISGLAQHFHNSRKSLGDEKQRSFATPFQFYSGQDPHHTLWPDPKLGIFSPTDPRFQLPGHSGACLPQNQDADKSSGQLTPQGGQSNPLLVTDLMSKPTSLERHCQVLYTAQDYIKYSEGADAVCSDILAVDDFPKLEGMHRILAEAQEAPDLLRRDFQPLFPSRNLSEGALSVITLSQGTEQDMSCWSEAMEEERETLTQQFVVAAKEVCARIKEEGFWADFIDPTSGTPYYSGHTNTTLFETDERYRLLGFRVEDLGCCKVICHRDFGRKVFVGTIFTDAHTSTGIVRDIFDELSLIFQE